MKKYLIMVVVIVLALVGVLFYKNVEKNDKENNQTETIVESVKADTTNEEKLKEENIKKVLLKDRSKEVVYGEINNKISVKIPKININSVDADDINKEINDIYEEVYGDEDSSKITSFKYEKNINGEILSLVVIKNIQTYSEYSTYSINIYTGEKIKNNELFKLNNLTELDVEKQVKTQMENDIKSIIIEAEDEFMKEITDEMIAEVNKTKIDENSKVYLNHENHLCIVIKKYEGTGEYNMPYDLNENRFIK